jgi:hypothetical protein
VNTAPVAAPVVSREVAPGVTIDTSMTPEQRFQVILKANAQPQQFHTDGTAMRLAQGDGRVNELLGGKSPPPTTASKAPPTPAELEATRRANIADFDAEMRAKGLQTAPQPRDASGRFASVPADQVDQRALEAASKAFAALPPVEREAKRAEYQTELRTIYEGRRLGESADAFRARQSGESPPAAPTGPTVPAYSDDWKAHVQDGWVDIDKLTTAHTSGYTIPRYVNNQTLHPSTIELLRQARAAGISQQQANAVLHQNAIKLGWVKA